MYRCRKELCKIAGQTLKKTIRIMQVIWRFSCFSMENDLQQMFTTKTKMCFHVVIPPGCDADRRGTGIFSTLWMDSHLPCIASVLLKRHQSLGLRLQKQRSARRRPPGVRRMSRLGRPGLAPVQRRLSGATRG